MAKATIEIKAQAGKESLSDKREFEVDAYVAVEKKICANDPVQKIELFAGPNSDISFFVLKSDKYEREENGCRTNGQPKKWIQYSFEEDSDKPIDLTRTLFIGADCAKDLLPESVEAIWIYNELPIDIYISILVGRKKVPTKKPDKPRQLAPAAN